MKKSTLLLPLAMIILASCGGNSSGTTTASNEPASDTTPASDTASTSGSTSENPGPSLTTIQDARAIGEALANDGKTTETYSVQGTVTSILNKNFTIQQGDYALYVFQSANLPSGFEVGKKVTVTGVIQNYKRNVQITDSPTITVDGTGDTISRYDITSFDSTLVGLSSRLVRVPNLTYVSETHTLNSNSTIRFNQGSTPVQMYVNRNLEDTIESAIITKMSGFTTSTVITYEGVLSFYESTAASAAPGTLQLLITSADNIVLPA